VIQPAQRSTFAGLLILSLVWLLVSPVLSAAGGDLLDFESGEDCKDHCEESCHGCGDCIMCLPSIHMIAGDGFNLGPVDGLPGWTVGSFAARLLPQPAQAIDHPPQNLL